MRVGVLIYKCKGGGAERVAGEVSRLLDEQGMEVYFCTFFQSREEYPHAGRRLSFPQEKSGSIVTVFRRIQWVRQIKKKHQLDVMISFLPQANLINILTGGHTVVSFRNNPEVELSSLYQAIFGLVLPYASRIVAVSKGVEESLKRRYPAIHGKTTTIYNPLGDFTVEARSLRPVRQILSVGRLEAQKGQKRLIAAFAKAAETRPELTLRIFGEGRLEPALKAQAQATGFADRIEILPFTHEIEREYKEADLFVLASDYEGFGNVILEALAKGLPVIATDCRFGPREILAPGTPVTDQVKKMEIHEFGILTPLCTKEEESIAQLTDAICRLCDDDELRARLNRQGTKRAQDFHREEIGQVWRRLINPFA